MRIAPLAASLLAPLAALALAAPAHAAMSRAFVFETDYATGSLSAHALSPRTAHCDVASVGSDASLRFHGGLLYVVNRYGGDNVQVIDPATNATLRQFSVGAGSNPHDIAFASDTHAYVSRFDATDLWVVNPATGAHTGTVSLAALADADGIPEMDRMIVAGPYLFVSLERVDRNDGYLPHDTSLVAVIDTRADTLVDCDRSRPGTQAIALGLRNPFTAFQFDPDSSRLLIGCVGAFGSADGGVERIDPVRLTSTGVAISESALGGDVTDVVWGDASKSWAIVATPAGVTALMGGAGDLAPSTKTLIDGEASFGPENYRGRNMHFGVREHAMGAVANGMARHGGVIPYTATFLIFSDYMRPPMRLAALMGIRVVHVFTHDSIALGEDGPTHQPIGQLMALRVIPNYTLIRPADATETTVAWCAALLNCHGPSALVLTRQNLQVLDRSKLAPAEGLLRGGYVLWQSSEGIPEIILIATGSEVAITLQAGEQLAAEGIIVRVVSLPCWELFDAQPVEYRRQVLPEAVRARVSVEAGTTIGWERYVGLDGASVGIDHFGASAPGEVVYREFGFTPEHIVAVAREVIKKGKSEG